VTVIEKVSPYSYVVQFDDGNTRKLHANHLRKYISRVRTVGLIYEGEEDFGQVLYQPSDDIGNDLTKFQTLDLTHLDTGQQQQLFKVLVKHKEVFSDKPGLCSLVKHSIRLEGQVKPQRQKPYRIPHLFKQEVDLQINQLLEDGLIEESNSAWAHPIVCVRKADGKSLRLCCDFRLINSFSVSDAFPMCLSEDLLNQVAPANFITTLDCSSGYWQIPMDESSRELTAFVTHRGQYQWKRMAFGLKGASSTYQRVANKILEPHADYANAYIDDFSIYSLTWEDHLRQLDDVLTSIRKSGLTLKLTKCVFAKPRVKWLGHVIGSGTKEVDPDKINLIRDISPPTTVKELRHFLGLTGYYRDFIPNYSSLALPLTDLTKDRYKVHDFVLGAIELKAFEDLKEVLMSAQVLSAPDFSKPFIIQTDASACAVAACLAQCLDGVERPIVFASCKLTDVQQRWSTIERESYAVIFALRRFESYVMGASITLYTDHDPLRFLTKGIPNSSKLTRWALALQQFDIVIKHRKGSLNRNCDALSRLF
jgi:hypothetical protein